LSDPQPEPNSPITQCVAERATKLTFQESNPSITREPGSRRFDFLKRFQDAPTTALVQQADKIAKVDGLARKALRLEWHKPVVVGNVGHLPDLAERRRLETLDPNTEGLEAKLY